MKKNIIAIFTILFLSNCGISNKDYEELKQELESSKSEIENLKSEIENLRNKNATMEDDNEQLDERRQIASTHSEAEALSCLNDYYDFYNANRIYRNPRVRRENENTFTISLEECNNDENFSSNEFFWTSIVVKLEIFENGKYEVRY